MGKKTPPTWALTADGLKAVNLFTGMVLEVSEYEEGSTGTLRYALWVYHLLKDRERIELVSGLTSDRKCLNEMRRLIGAPELRI